MCYLQLPVGLRSCEPERPCEQDSIKQPATRGWCSSAVRVRGARSQVARLRKRKELLPGKPEYMVVDFLQACHPRKRALSTRFFATVGRLLELALRLTLLPERGDEYAVQEQHADPA